MHTTGDVARPLLITSDAEVLDDLLRLAAAAGVAVDAVPDAVAARAFWSAAPLVLIGDDMACSTADAVARGRLRRRPGVVLVTRDGEDSRIWPRAVAVGAEHVSVLPEAEPWLVAAVADATDPPAPPAPVIATLGGRGGAGASTLAAALAVTAARAGERVTFVDADPLGGGADLLFGGEGALGARWSDLATGEGRLPARALREALPYVAGLAVLAWDRADTFAAAQPGASLEVPADVMSNVLDAAARASDLLVVDLPRRFDDATCAVLAAADLLFVITPAEVRAAAATARIAMAISGYPVDARLVVRGPAPGGLRAVDIASAVGLPLAGELRPEPDLAACLERGEAPAGRGVGPLARLCERLLAHRGHSPGAAEGAQPGDDTRWLA